MARIPAKDQEFLRSKFGKELVGTVNLALFIKRETSLVLSDQAKHCKETEELLEEVVGLSDMINLRVYDSVADDDKAKEYGIDKTPAILFDEARGVRYFGFPSGYEFPSLIQDIIDVSRGATDLTDRTKSAVRRIEKDVHIQVFVTLT